jgi:hypothetical protein
MFILKHGVQLNFKLLRQTYGKYGNDLFIGIISRAKMIFLPLTGLFLDVFANFPMN